MTETTAEKMTAAGILPLELTEHSVLSCSDGSRRGIFTELCINSLELGALYPAQYRVVTNRNSQSLRLATWAFRRVSELLAEREDDVWISIYMPAKALMRDNLGKLLENERKKSGRDFSRLVIEVSSEILYEDAEQAAAKMKELRGEYGVRFLLSEFGDEYCPVLRLPQYPVDFVLLDSFINNAEALRTSSAAASVEMAKKCGIKVLARLSKPVTARNGAGAPDYYVPDLSAPERRDE